MIDANEGSLPSGSNAGMFLITVHNQNTNFFTLSVKGANDSKRVSHHTESNENHGMMDAIEQEFLATFVDNDYQHHPTVHHSNPSNPSMMLPYNYPMPLGTHIPPGVAHPFYTFPVGDISSQSFMFHNNPMTFSNLSQIEARTLFLQQQHQLQLQRQQQQQQTHQQHQQQQQQHQLQAMNQNSRKRSSSNEGGGNIEAKERRRLVFSVNLF